MFVPARLLPFALAFVWMLSTSAHAGLLWPQKEVEVKVDARTTVAEVRFPFENRGDKSVDVTQVVSSCGCTTVDLDKRHYEPGEGGVIVARYTVAEHTGLQKKSVMVSTNDVAEPTELTLVVRIPEVLRISPSFVTWKHGEEPTSKQITLEMMQDTPIKNLDIQSSSSSVKAELETVEKGRKYRITITPGQTDQHLFSTITVKTKFGDNERVFRTYATVQPPAREE